MTNTAQAGAGSAPAARPDCDGTTNAATRNCPRLAVWQIADPDNPTGPFLYGACAQHLHQVGGQLLGGERGGLRIRRIQTEER